MKNSLKRLGSVTKTLLVLVLPLIVWTHRQQIFDWTRLRNYQPSSAVIDLATATTMNDLSRHLFYVYHPSLESKKTFNSHCTDSERTIVLGCYVSGKGIYVYDVTDARLSGIEEVTSAHEMLHVAYERLSASEKKRINNLIVEAYADVSDKRIRDTVESYKNAGADTTNELHSILGTEVSKLPSDLETYYRRYFIDRSKVVQFSEKYEQAFDERRTKVAEDDLKLKNLKSRIDELQTSLQTRSSDLVTEKKRMDTLIANNQVTEYNATVPGYNRSVAAYNADVNEARALIGQYNIIVVERNSLALEENELIKAIDSRPNTIKSQ